MQAGAVSPDFSLHGPPMIPFLIGKMGFIAAPFVVNTGATTSNNKQQQAVAGALRQADPPLLAKIQNVTISHCSTAAPALALAFAFTTPYPHPRLTQALGSSRALSVLKFSSDHTETNHAAKGQRARGTSASSAPARDCAALLVLKRIGRGVWRQYRMSGGQPAAAASRLLSPLAWGSVTGLKDHT